MFTVTLPGGYFHNDGSLHLDAQVALLSGKEEEMLSAVKTGDCRTLITKILAKCIRRLGFIDNITEEITGKMLVADRQFLLLKLREYTFGERIQGTVSCPGPGCGKKVDIDFCISDIPVKKLEEKKPFYTCRLPPDAAIRQNGNILDTVVFRLPHGRDRELLSPLLTTEPLQLQDQLLEACITQIGQLTDLSHGLIASLSDKTKKTISEEIWKRAPAVEANFVALCPECGITFEFPFDIYQFFLEELRTSLDLLYREVHYLAFHYHWSEEEIMNMPRKKRRQYLRILSEEIERMNNEE